jgi:predicted DCC family thiol-disulfide oxidoreductase YuxK
MANDQHPIILFDGVCNLCNRSVNFIIDRDPKQLFRFASLQSPLGQQLVTQFGFSPTELSSLILVQGELAYRRSSAALRIASRLTFPWNCLVIGLVIPRPIRDFVYDIIAQNRYRWFGKTEICRLPTPDRLHRFLDQSPN